MKVVKILAIVVVTSVVTVLCIRSGQAIVKASVPAETVYQTTTTDSGGGGGGGPMGTGNDRGGGGDRPDVEDPSRPVVGGGGGDDDEPNGPPETSESGALEVDGAKAVGNPDRLVANDSRPENATGTDDAVAAMAEDGESAATGRSLYDGRYASGPTSASRSRAPPPAVVRGKQIAVRHRPADGGENDDRDDDDDDDRGDGGGGHDVDVVLDAGVYHAANRYRKRFYRGPLAVNRVR